jgi:hypothetical protein
VFPPRGVGVVVFGANFSFSFSLALKHKTKNHID